MRGTVSVIAPSARSSPADCLARVFSRRSDRRMLFHDRNRRYDGRGNETHQVLAQDSFTCGITSDLNYRLKREVGSTRLKSSVWVKRFSSRSIQVQAFTRTPSLV